MQFVNHFCLHAIIFRTVGLLAVEWYSRYSNYLYLLAVGCTFIRKMCCLYIGPKQNGQSYRESSFSFFPPQPQQKKPLVRDQGVYEKLWYLDLSHNNLTSCPNWVSNFISLELLNLRENKVMGVVTFAMHLWEWCERVVGVV